MPMKAIIPAGSGKPVAPPSPGTPRFGRDARPVHPSGAAA